MPTRRVVDSVDDLEFFPRNLSHTEILQRLATFSHEDVEALRVLAEDRLRRWWALTYYNRDTMRPH